MPEAREIRKAVGLARAELERTIATETSAFRARLFAAELERLDSAAREFAASPSRFSRARLAAPLETIAFYTLECVECWADGAGAAEGIVLLNKGETMRRLARVLDAARSLRRAA